MRECDVGDGSCVCRAELAPEQTERFPETFWRVSAITVSQLSTPGVWRNCKMTMYLLSTLLLASGLKYDARR